MTPEERLIAALKASNKIVLGQTTGSIGGRCNVSGKEGSVSAIARSPIPSGSCVAIKTDDGQWYALPAKQTELGQSKFLYKRKQRGANTPKATIVSLIRLTVVTIDVLSDYTRRKITLDLEADVAVPLVEYQYINDGIASLGELNELANTTATDIKSVPTEDVSYSFTQENDYSIVSIIPTNPYTSSPNYKASFSILFLKADFESLFSQEGWTSAWQTSDPIPYGSFGQGYFNDIASSPIEIEWDGVTGIRVRIGESSADAEYIEVNGVGATQRAELIYLGSFFYSGTGFANSPTTSSLYLILRGVDPAASLATRIYRDGLPVGQGGLLDLSVKLQTPVLWSLIANNNMIPSLSSYEYIATIDNNLIKLNLNNDIVAASAGQTYFTNGFFEFGIVFDGVDFTDISDFPNPSQNFEYVKNFNYLNSPIEVEVVIQGTLMAVTSVSFPNPITISKRVDGTYRLDYFDAIPISTGKNTYEVSYRYRKRGAIDWFSMVDQTEPASPTTEDLTQASIGYRYRKRGTEDWFSLD